MKLKFFFFFCLLLIECELDAQTYRQQFDKLDQLNFTDNLLKSNNFNEDNENLHNIISYLMSAYVEMYKATGDVKYLNKCIITTKRVMDRRNDNYPNYYNSRVPGYGSSCSWYHYPINGVLSSLGWFRGDCSTINTAYMEYGSIIAPMAQMLLVLQDHSELDNNPLPTEVLSSTPGLDGLNCYPSGSTILTYHQYVVWLRDKIYESLNELYTNHWNQTAEFFGDDTYETSDAAGINQQAIDGYAYLLMHEVSLHDGITEGYGIIAQRVATHLWNVLAQNATQFHNGEPMIIWKHGLSGGASLYNEDISHARLDIDLAEELYVQGIPASNGLYFSSGHMNEFANTFSYLVLGTPKDIKGNVYGTNLNCPSEYCNGYDNAGNCYFAGEYAQLCKYNRKIYQAVSDIYSPFQKINGSVNSVFGTTDANGLIMLGLAHLVRYENIFNPLSVSDALNNGSAMSCAGICAGDFDGSGQMKFITTKSNGAFCTFTKLADNHVSSAEPFNHTVNLISTQFAALAASNLDGVPGDEIVGINSGSIYVIKQSGIYLQVLGAPYTLFSGQNLTSVSIGDVDSNNPGNEILVVNKTDSKLYEFSFNGTNLTLINSFSLPNIEGVAIGNFDVSSGDEIAIVNTTGDGVVKMCKINSGVFSTISSTIYPLGNQNVWSGKNIAAGDFDNDGIDELAAYNSNTTTIYIYKLKSGVCTNVGEESFPENQNISAMCAAKFNGDFKTSLVELRDFDAQISIFNMDGLCPGLNLNNQEINTSTSVDDGPNDNNYPIDYHVNNAIVAGNDFIISSPSIVDMSSGKEIIFQNGFLAADGADLHAYIAPGQECGTPAFFAPNPNNLRSSIDNAESVHPIVFGLLSVTPNPNSGKFNVSVSSGDGTEGINHLEVYDLLGKLILEKGVSDSKSIDVDLSGSPQGMYYLRCIDKMGMVRTQRVIVQ